MRILLDANNYIIGYEEKGLTNGFIECSNIPSDFYENYLSYKYIDDEFIFDANKGLTVSEVQGLYSELADILKWFTDTDYMVNKITRGNWETTDQRWIDYLVEYDIKHARKEEIEAILNI